MNKIKKNHKSSLYVSLIIFASFFMCIGYASVNSITLNLNAIGNVSTPKKLFIADVIVNENNQNSIVNLYDETFLDAKIELLDSESTVTLSITIKNNTNYDYSFVQVDYIFGNNTYDNENVIFDLIGLTKDDIIKSKESLTFDLVFKYDDLLNITSNILNCKLNFNFKNISGMPLGQLVLANETESTNNEDGLYSYQDIYYYSGSNVNNYIWYNCKNGFNSGENNCEIWRILDVESDGSVKIIKDDVLSQSTIASIETKTNFWHIQINADWKANNLINAGKIKYDAKGRRPVNTSLENSYCVSNQNGCNAFAANLTYGTFSNLNVDDDSSIKLYLENVYYEHALTESAKNAIKINEYNIGIIDINIGKDIDSIYSIERKIRSNSKIALLNVSSYMLASKNTSCRTNFLGSGCANDNWLKSNSQFVFLNGKVTSTTAQVFLEDTSGLIISRDADYDAYLRPVVTLKSNIIATGTGCDGDYYTLVG